MTLTLHRLPQMRAALAVRRRFGLALCASVMIHAWILSPLASPQRPYARTTSMINARIEAREAGPDSLFARNTGERLAPFLASPTLSTDASFESTQILEPAYAAGEPKRALSAAAKLQPEWKAPLAHSVEPKLQPLPQPVDTNWYGAHELDVFPRALAPLRFSDSAAAGLRDAGERLLLWLRIDEYGQVIEVNAGDAAISRHWVEAARAFLANVRFAPARKDERAVKSRLLLGIDFARG